MCEPHRTRVPWRGAQYGSNDCDVNWGTNYTLDLDLLLDQDIVAGHKIDVDLKVDGLIPFKLNCALCGAECTFTIPIIRKTVTIPPVPCPLKARAEAMRRHPRPRAMSQAPSATKMPNPTSTGGRRQEVDRAVAAGELAGAYQGVGQGQGDGDGPVWRHRGRRRRSGAALMHRR